MPLDVLTTLVSGNPHPGALRLPPPGTVGRGDPRATGVMPAELQCITCGATMQRKHGGGWGRRFVCPNARRGAPAGGRHRPVYLGADNLPKWGAMPHILIEEAMSKPYQRRMNKRERQAADRELARRVAVMRQFVVVRVMAHVKQMAEIARDGAGHWNPQKEKGNE